MPSSHELNTATSRFQTQTLWSKVRSANHTATLCFNQINKTFVLTRAVWRESSLPERGDPIWKLSLEVIIVKKTVPEWLIRFLWTKYESYILHAEFLRLVRKKYEIYILHTSAVMYTFQNLNTAVNEKVWPDLDLGRRPNWGRGVCYWKVFP